MEKGGGCEVGQVEWKGCEWYNRGSYGTGLWNGIANECGGCSECVKWKVGKGSNVYFWTDSWEEGGCLMERFSRIYAIAQKNNAYVEEMWCNDGGGGFWNIAVNRNLNDWEVEYEAILRVLSNIKLTNDRDRLVWKHKKNEMFTVRSYYDFITQENSGRFNYFAAKQI